MVFPPVVGEVVPSAQLLCDASSGAGAVGDGLGVRPDERGGRRVVALT